MYQPSRFGLVAEQREIQALDGLGAFLGQLGADALFFLQAGDFMAAGAAVEAHQELAARLSGWDRPDNRRWRKSRPSCLRVSR